jgi:hypothetical protein
MATTKARIVELIEQGLDNLEIVRLANVSKGHVLTVRKDYNKTANVVLRSVQAKPRLGTARRAAYDKLVSIGHPVSIKKAMRLTGLDSRCIKKLESRYGVKLYHAP